MNFGERLREMRKEKGLTLREVAERAGIDFTYLSKIENERIPYTPAVETIRQLADALKVDSIELLTLAGKLPKELEALRGNKQARRFFDKHFWTCWKNGRRSATTRRVAVRRKSRWLWNGHSQRTGGYGDARGSFSLGAWPLGTTQRIRCGARAFCSVR